MNFYIKLVFSLYFVTLQSKTGQPYWIDMDDITSIKLGSTFDQVSNNIGYPIEFQSSESKNGNVVSSYNYRVKEYGYKFIRFIKPDAQEKKFWLDQEYFLQFNYDDNILKSLSRKNTNSISNEHQLYEVKSLMDIENKPIWIDIEDLFKISVGMSEDSIIQILGLPAQLISWEQKDKKEIKNVFYRCREIYHRSDSLLSVSKTRFQRKDRDLERNYIILKKENEKVNFVVNSIKLSGSKVYITSLDEQRKEYLGSMVKSINYKGTLFKNLGKIKKLLESKEQVQKKLDTGNWSTKSINIKFNYEDAILKSIRKLSEDTTSFSK